MRQLRTSIDPNEIARSLQKPINRNIFFVQIFHRWPPASVQVINVITFAERLYDTPVSIGYGKPFAVSGSDVNVYRAEIIVFLMTWCTATRNLEER
jgi:hypothetical protein